MASRWWLCRRKTWKGYYFAKKIQMWTGRSQQLSLKLSVTESMFFMQEKGAWGQSVSRTCVRVSGMWHRGILRLKLRHSPGTSGTAHTPSVHEVPDLACSNTEEQNRDTNARMSSYSWVFHGYNPLWPFDQFHMFKKCRRCSRIINELVCFFMFTSHLCQRQHRTAVIVEKFKGISSWT